MEHVIATDSFWTEKYQQHIATMIGMCYRYVPDRATAEDLAHDAFLRAIEKADTLRLLERFKPWITRITLNTVMDYLREKEREKRTEKDVELAAEYVPETDYDIDPKSMMEAIRQADFSQEEIVEAISELPKHHRTVLNLYVFEGLNHRKIAETLGISANTSKSHLMRARRALQVILFKKTKKKNKSLMTWILPFFGVDAAFDRYLRRSIDGFEMPPQQPLNMKDLPAAASQIPLRIRFRAFRLPFLATGLGAVAVGAILLTTPNTQPNMPAQPEVASVTTEEPAADSTAAAVLTPDPIVETKEPSQPSRKLKTTPQKSKIPQSDTLFAMPADSLTHTPVVVKKIVRRNNRTIVVKDSNS